MSPNLILESHSTRAAHVKTEATLRLHFESELKIHIKPPKDPGLWGQSGKCVICNSPLSSKGCFRNFSLGVCTANRFCSVSMYSGTGQGVEEKREVYAELQLELSKPLQELALTRDPEGPRRRGVRRRIGRIPVCPRDGICRISVLLHPVRPWKPLGMSGCLLQGTLTCIRISLPGWTSKFVVAWYLPTPS